MELGTEQDVIFAGMFCDVFSKGNYSNLENEIAYSVWNIVNQLENDSKIK